MYFENHIEEFFRELRREVRRLLEDIERTFELNKPMWDLSSRSLEPLCTIHETENEVVVTMDMPLVNKDSISINVTEDTLEVTAELREEVSLAIPGCSSREVRFRRFHKVIRLPVPVEPSGARARFRGGILEVRLPKKIKGHRVPIE